MTSIALEIQDDAAQLFHTLDADHKKELSVELEKKIRLQAHFRLIEEVSRQAGQRGLTQEILDDMLANIKSEPQQ